MIYSLKLTFWLIFTIAAGLCVLKILFRQKIPFLLMESIAIAYPLGLGFITFEMVILSILGLKFTTLTIAFGAFPLFIIAAYFGLKNKDDTSVIISKVESKFQFSEILLVGATSLQIVYIFFRALIKPIESFDAVAIYAPKAKIFFLANTIPSDFFFRFKGIIEHIEYPLLLPLAQTYFYTFMGSLDDHLVKIIFPLFYLSIIVMTYAILKRYCSRKVSLLFTFLLSTVPSFANFGTIGYADILLTFYYCASAFYLYLWINDKKSSLLILSIIFSGLALWLKTNALMLLPVNILVMSAYLIFTKFKEYKSPLFYICSLIAIIFCYNTFFIQHFNLILHEDFALSGLSEKLLKNITQTHQILHEYQKQFFGPKKWNLIWVAFILLLITNIKKVFCKDIRYITLTIFFVFAGYTATYLLTPIKLSYYLSTTASRFFFHFLPIVILFSAMMFKKCKLDY